MQLVHERSGIVHERNEIVHVKNGIVHVRIEITPVENDRMLEEVSDNGETSKDPYI